MLKELIENVGLPDLALSMVPEFVTGALHVNILFRLVLRRLYNPYINETDEEQNIY